MFRNPPIFKCFNRNFVLLQFGGLTYSMVKWDVDTQQSKGCGFVSFDTDEAADKAISEMHMSEFYGREIKVQPAVSFMERANKKRLRDESI